MHIRQDALSRNRKVGGDLGKTRAPDPKWVCFRTDAGSSIPFPFQGAYVGQGWEFVLDMMAIGYTAERQGDTLVLTQVYFDDGETPSC